VKKRWWRSDEDGGDTPSLSPCKDRDYGLFRKLGLDGLECGVTLRRPVAVSVGMDRNFDKIKAGRLR